MSDDANQIAEHTARLDKGEARFDELCERIRKTEKRLESMDGKLDQVCEILGVYRNVKGFITVMRWIGVVVKYLWWVGAILGALWLLARTGQWLPPKVP